MPKQYPKTYRVVIILEETADGPHVAAVAAVDSLRSLLADNETLHCYVFEDKPDNSDAFGVVLNAISTQVETN